jgi:hypothetical protein
MNEPQLNKCFDFKQEYTTIEKCEKAGNVIEEKVIRSETVSGTAFKCTPVEKG